MSVPVPDVAEKSPVKPEPFELHAVLPTFVISGEDIALWAHCSSGMTHEQFIDWLTLELTALDSIDPTCEK